MKRAYPSKAAKRLAKICGATMREIVQAIRQRADQDLLLAEKLARCAAAAAELSTKPMTAEEIAELLSGVELIDGTRFVTVPQAAARSGLNKGHIRKMAAQVWAAQGKARLLHNGRNRSHWLIHVDADPRFAPRQEAAA